MKNSGLFFSLENEFKVRCNPDLIVPPDATRISNKSLASCRSIKSVDIHNNVTDIYGPSFAQCYNLCKITVDKDNPNYTSINGVLYSKDMKQLLSYPRGKCDKSFTIPDGVTTIEREAFKGCTNLESVTIPDGVNLIKRETFKGCTSLKSVTIPNGVTIIADKTFDGCTSLKSVTIPNSVTAINFAAFSGCTNLKSIDIPNSVTKIGNYAFDGCTSLESVVIPDGVTKIENETFDGCTSLKSITIPDSVTAINCAAFKGCTSLESVIIPDGVTKIERAAFEGCTSLKSVTIPDSVTEISNDAFAYCTSLREIIAGENNPSYTSINGVLYSKDKDELICYPSNKDEDSFEISDIVTKIDNYAFYSCKNLREIIVDENNPNYSSANGVLYSKDKVGLMFYPTGRNDEVFTVPESVIDIYGEAFAECTNLKSIAIPNNAYIFKGAFRNCSGIESVMFFDTEIKRKIKDYCNTNDIGESAFEGCTSLTEIAVPDDVRRIGEKAFRGCTNLKSITLPDSVYFIGHYAFEKCTSLERFVFPEKASLIAMGLFKGCKSLKSVELNEIRSIYCRAFEGCKSLKYIDLDKVAGISYYAFGESSLKSITIPDTVEEYNIGNFIFGNCNNLGRIYYKGSSYAPDEFHEKFYREQSNSEYNDIPVLADSEPDDYKRD